MDKKQFFWFLILITMLVATAPAIAVDNSSTNLKVTLINATTNQSVANASIGVKEVLPDGSLKWAASGKTDGSGVVNLSLSKLGTGTKYILYTKQLSNLYSYSDPIGTTGETTFLIGKSPITVKAGGTNELMPDTSVTILKEKSDGSYGWYTRGTTDSSGRLILDLPNMGDGQRYQLYAYSPWDKSKQYSELITEDGPFTFTVGNAPLKATVTNTHTGTPLADLSVTVYEVLDTGKNKWVRSQKSSATGQVAFDLDGFKDNRNYRLVAKPYNGGYAYTSIISSPGNYDFKVGDVEVTVTSGASNTPLAETKITAYKLLPDNKKQWLTSGTTDAGGMIRFDFTDASAGDKYVLLAKSPVDGSYKYSSQITSTGIINFVVGEKPLEATLVDALMSTPLANLQVTAYEILDTGKLKWVTRKTTDSAGKLALDLDGLGSGKSYKLASKPFNDITIYSAPITSAGALTLPLGNLYVLVTSGNDDSPIPEAKVKAYSIDTDGNKTSASYGYADGNGLIRLHLPKLGKGGQYVLSSKSLTDGSYKYSPPITEPGKTKFVVGNAPLQVSLINGITQQPVAGTKVTAYRITEDDKKKWTASGNTDESGNVSFDLNGLGTGTKYVLSSKPYNGGTVYSEALTSTGPYQFKVGKLEISVQNGGDNAALPDARITAYRLLDDGKKKWVTSGNTDSLGVIRFDLSGLGDGTQYILHAKSTTDGSSKYSAPITANGKHTFTVGNAPLRVQLVNGLSQAPLPELRITAYERLDNGDLKWRLSHTTDAVGKAAFDLDGLGSGRTYLLKTRPYNAGDVISTDITTPGDFVFRVGTVPVTLTDGDNNASLSGKKITAYEKYEDGSLHWKKSGTTDANGVIRFDLVGLNQQAIYVFKAYGPFGQNKKFYSPWVMNEGPVDFTITRDGDHDLDREPPWIAIDSPTQNSEVGSVGFILMGRATDDHSLENIEVTLIDPIKGTSNLMVSNISEAGAWSIPIPSMLISSGETITLTAKAYDKARNASSAESSLRVVDDTAIPVLEISSHSNGDQVTSMGFLVAGAATDNTGVTALYATLVDPIRGTTIDNQLLSLSPETGKWALSVTANQISVGETVQLTLRALDSSGNEATARVTLNVENATVNALQLINRITYGATPGLLTEIEQIGGAAYLTQQLNPASIDDSAFDAVKASWAPESRDDMAAYQFAYSTYSRKQLLEVMTQFWDNHFNTDINKTRRVEYEVSENQQFRTHALGRFRDLLEASAKSPGMMIYLDNIASRRGAPNENYARELLELHTMGVGGGYTSDDIVEVAKVFTGWYVRNEAFTFDSNRHEPGDKVVLGQTIAESGIGEGELVLDMLARHPSTANFVCTKLLQLFVTDSPTTASVSSCSNVFLGSDGNIGNVLTHILTSSEFNDSANFHAKVKTPMEYVTGILRNFNATFGTRDLRYAMDALAMPLYRNPVPTGWPETGQKWVSSNQLMIRIQFANEVLQNEIGGNARYTTVTPREVVLNAGFESTDGVLGYLFKLTTANEYTPLEWDTAKSVLTDNGALPFDINRADADEKIRRTLGTMLGYPSYQLQ